MTGETRSKIISKTDLVKRYLDRLKSSQASSDQKFWLTSPACCLTYFLTIIIKTVICAGAGAVQIGQSNRQAYSKGEN